MTMPFKGRAGGYTGELRVLRQLNPYEFGVELWVMRDGENQNKWNYQNVRDFYLTFVGQPILIAYIGPKVGDGHNSAEKTDLKTGEPYQSYMGATAERIVGTLSDDKNDFSLRERDGHTWIVAKGRLFAFYAKELVDTIVRTGRMEVSAETLVYEEHQDGEVTVFTSWRGLGVTILGEGVAPAVPGANIARLNAMQREFKEVKLRAASLLKNPEKNAPDNGKKLEKGVKELNVYSKRQLAALAARFEGYTVLAAGEKDGKVFVALQAKDGTFCSYVLESGTETIVPERFQSTALNAVMQFGEETLKMDAQDLTESMQTRLCAAEKAAEDAKKDLAAATERMNAMQTAETARRLSAAKDAAKRTLAEFNANRAQKVEEDAIAGILSDIDAGAFAACQTKDGAWNGESEVRKAVFAVCGEAVAKLDAQEAAKHKNVFAWEKFAGNQNDTDDGSVGALLSKWGVGQSEA